MDKHDVIYLLEPATRVNEIGQRVPGEYTEKEVFAKKTSVSQSEFFTAGQSGLKPDCMFLVYTFEYNGESYVKHNRIVYTIYRTYVNGDNIELYCEVRRNGDKYK